MAAKADVTNTKILLQTQEFEAAAEFVTATQGVLGTAVVDDDYPKMRHYYESALQNLIRALRANRRL